VTADFHEFGFGLVHQEGYFYATLSMAMRLMANEKQQPDRGKTIRIGMDGRYEGINAGLRTPNGIGIGPDNELFVTDNQGEWLPANKLIHVKPGTFYGMRWGLPDSLTGSVVDTPPAIWMPEHEIANSPSEPILIPSGPYSGQLLHGDVTHGGIKRDFLEKVDGEYQGAVFRFTQGLAAGVNRLCWGPDSALYIGEVGMVGGWSWREKKFGLQRMTFNGRPVFEMLAIRARHNGFEIEFTEAVAKDFDASKMLVQQWWYLPTSSYGGPKKDLEQLRIADWSLSSDNKKVSIKIPGIKAGRVIYFRLPDDLRSAVGRSLWSSEAWYTLNNIPTE
jgi:cytochrome c